MPGEGHYNPTMPPMHMHMPMPIPTCSLGTTTMPLPASQPRTDTVSGHADMSTRAFFVHSSAPRINTDSVMAQAIQNQYPQYELVIAPERTCNLLGYADAGHAELRALEHRDGVDEVACARLQYEHGYPSYQSVNRTRGRDTPSSLKWIMYNPPARRLDGGRGTLVERALFSKMVYTWRGREFLVYLVDGRDGDQSYPELVNYFILAPERAHAEQLVLAAGRWSDELHNEIWVFDGGAWQKSSDLYDSVRGASWDAVILDPGMKSAIVEDHKAFFASRDTYAGLKVPWKRGVIYYGPPGNGKTISVKATMHMLSQLEDPVPSLYVRTLNSFMGPEYAIRQIFQKARQLAPCYLIFEDLDTIVSDNVRSYFLNEVDGLKANDGIFMVGSTNHLDRLDPGISKRPSRFDRKYYFPDPDRPQREAYCRFWQGKLADSEAVEFPDRLVGAIAGITDGFSFAYMQEAFVAALLAIARGTGDAGAGGKEEKQEVEGVASQVAGLPVGRDSRTTEDDWVVDWRGAGTEEEEDGDEDYDDDDDGDDDLDGLILWVEIKKQVEILREGMKEKPGAAASSS